MNLKEKIIKSLEEKGEWFGKVPIELIQGVSPYNARKHNIKENITELQDSIGLTGEIREAITLNQNFQIVKGQRRYIVAKDWKIKEIPVIIRRYVDKMDELADSYVENELTTPLSSVDKEDVIYTLAKVWGEAKTAQVLGISVAAVSNVVRFREAPKEVQAALEGASSKDKKQLQAIFKQVLEKEGPQKLRQIAPKVRQMSDRDKEQFAKDYRAGETVNIDARHFKSLKSIGPERIYESFTIKLKKTISSALTKISRKLKKDKLDLIEEILEQWIEEHQGILKA